MTSRRIAACHDQVCADVTLIPKEVSLQHGHDGDYTRFAAGRERVELDVGGHDGRGEFRVCGRSSTGTPDLRSDVMQLLAVLIKARRSAFTLRVQFSITATHLVGDNGTAGGSRVGGDHDTSIVDTPDDGRAGRCGLW